LAGKVIPVDIEARAYSSLEKGISIFEGTRLVSGSVKSGTVLFNLNTEPVMSERLSLSLHQEHQTITKLFQILRLTGMSTA